MFRTKIQPKSDKDEKSPVDGDRPPTKTPPPKRDDQSREPRRLQPRTARSRAASAAGRNQRRMVRIGLLLIVGVIGISGGIIALHRSTVTTQVYVATRAIPSGALITNSDVTLQQIPLPGIQGALPMSRILNNHAAMGILSGEVLTSGLTTSQQAQAAQSIVGASLATGHLPGTGVAMGDTVEIIFTGQNSLFQASALSTAASGSSAPGASGSSAPGTTTGSVLGTAVVASVTLGSSGSSTVIDLMLPVNEAPTVAAAAANNDISIVSES